MHAYFAHGAAAAGLFVMALSRLAVFLYMAHGVYIVLHGLSFVFLSDYADDDCLAWSDLMAMDEGACLVSTLAIAAASEASLGLTLCLVCLGLSLSQVLGITVLGSGALGLGAWDHADGGVHLLGTALQNGGGTQPSLLVHPSLSFGTNTEESRAKPNSSSVSHCLMVHSDGSMVKPCLAKPGSPCTSRLVIFKSTYLAEFTGAASQWGSPWHATTLARASG